MTGKSAYRKTTPRPGYQLHQKVDLSTNLLLDTGVDKFWQNAAKIKEHKLFFFFGGEGGKVGETRDIKSPKQVCLQTHEQSAVML